MQNARGVEWKADRQNSSLLEPLFLEDAKAKTAVECLFEEIDSRISKEFGNVVSPYINTKAEFKAKHKKGLAVIKSILKSHNLIYGERLETLL